MKPYIFALAFIILAVDTVNALRCHQCDYIDGKDVGTKGQRFHKSCQSGKKPNKKFLVRCPLISDVCLKVVAEGRNDQRENVKYTVRGCGIRTHFPEYETTDKCEDKNSSVLSGLLGYQLEDNFKGTVCLCEEDKCNSSSMVKVTQSLMIFVIGIFSFKYFLGFY